MRLFIKYTEYLYSLVLMIAFLPYLYLSIFVCPVADDFGYASLALSNGVFEGYKTMFLHWTGRFSATFFALNNPLYYQSFVLYKTIPVLILFLSFASNWYFIKSVFMKTLKRIEILNISLLMSLLFIYHMPIISEGIYWYTGAVTYQLGCIVSIVYISLLYRIFQNNLLLGNRILHIILLSILLFLAIGFNEVLMLLLLLFSSILLTVVHQKNLTNKGLTTYLFILSIISASIMLLAPGNSERGSNFANRHDLVHSTIYTILQTGRFFLEWINSAALLLLSIIYIALSNRLKKKLNLFSQSFYLSPWKSLTLLFLVIFLSVFPAYWATGILGQHRTLNVAYFVFIIVWFINLTVCSNWLIKRSFKLSKFIKFSFSIITVGTLMFSKNGFNAIDDILSGNASLYNQQMKARYGLLNSTNDTIYFKAIQHPPKSLFINDITHDPSHWLNISYSEYFGVKEKVILKKD